jgi:hypothetical protein
MTQIAAFKCRDGVVLGADSQETRGTFKVRVPKLVLRPEYEFDAKNGTRVIFAGAGDGPFVDKLIDEMWKAAKASGKPSIALWYPAMQEAILSVHEKFWKVYPRGNQPLTSIAFAISTPDEVELYKSEGPIVSRIENYFVSGSSDELAPFIADSMIEKVDTIEEGAILAAYLLAMSSEYADGVGGDLQVIAMKKNGECRGLTASTINGLVETLQALRRLSGDLLLKASNLHLPDEEFKSKLKEFSDYVSCYRQLHATFDEDLADFHISRAGITKRNWPKSEKEMEDAARGKGKYRKKPRYKPRMWRRFSDG